MEGAVLGAGLGWKYIHQNIRKSIDKNIARNVFFCISYLFLSKLPAGGVQFEISNFKFQIEKLLPCCMDSLSRTCPGRSLGAGVNASCFSGTGSNPPL